MPRSPEQALRRRGEQLALEHYERLGFALLAHHQRTSAGEVGLVVRDARTIVLVEIDARRAGGPDPPPRRPAARRLRSLAAAWLAEHPDRAGGAALRLDAVTVVLDAHDRLLALEQVEAAA